MGRFAGSRPLSCPQRQVRAVQECRRRSVCSTPGGQLALPSPLVHSATSLPHPPPGTRLWPRRNAPPPLLSVPHLHPSCSGRPISVPPPPNTKRPANEANGIKREGTDENLPGIELWKGEICRERATVPAEGTAAIPFYPLSSLNLAFLFLPARTPGQRHHLRRPVSSLASPQFPTGGSLAFRPSAAIAASDLLHDSNPPPASIEPPTRLNPPPGPTPNDRLSPPPPLPWGRPRR